MKLNIKNKQTTQSKNGQKTQIDIPLFSNQTHASSAPYNQQFTVAKTWKQPKQPLTDWISIYLCYGIFVFSNEKWSTTIQAAI